MRELIKMLAFLCFVFVVALVVSEAQADEFEPRAGSELTVYAYCTSIDSHLEHFSLVPKRKWRESDRVFRKLAADGDCSFGRSNRLEVTVIHIIGEIYYPPIDAWFRAYQGQTADGFWVYGLYPREKL